jgi:mannose/fructose-specific phosphotransferase system component IIA
MVEDSLVHNKAIFKEVPITTNENVPLYELGHSICRRKSIPKRKIEELAIEKYRTTGEGIVFTDITGAFPCSKNKAQRILKDCRNKTISKTSNDSKPLLFRSFKRTSPQQYFPSCIRADIIEHFKKRDNVLKHPTEVSSSSNALSHALVQQKSQHFLDVLTSLPFAPLCIHKLQLQLSVNSESYEDFTLFFKENKQKSQIHSERIGKAQGITMCLIATMIVNLRGKKR